MKKVLFVIFIALFSANCATAQSGILSKIKNAREKKENVETSVPVDTKREKAFMKYFIAADEQQTHFFGQYNRVEYYDLPDTAEVFKKRFEAQKALYYEKDRTQGDVVIYIRRVDNFYKDKLPEMRSDLVDKVKNLLKFMDNYKKAVRSNPEYIKNFNGSDFTNSPKNFDSHIFKLQKMLNLVPDDAEIISLIKELETTKADIQEYVSSGDNARDIATVEDMKLDHIRCPKALNTNPAMIALVKKEWKVSYPDSPIYLVNLMSTDWWIKKNDIGLPSYQALDVKFTFKEMDGKCYLGEGAVRKEYLGGGKYAEPHFKYYDKTQMKCSNTLK